jgi:multicomponent Na+:H+ antiporter subunit B
MRRKSIATFVFIVFLLMSSIQIIPLEGADSLYQYFITNFQADTGSINAVSGIYLDYRVFDTMFETLLLLVSVIGIIYFSRHEGDY